MAVKRRRVEHVPVRRWARPPVAPIPTCKTELVTPPPVHGRDTPLDQETPTPLTKPGAGRESDSDMTEGSVDSMGDGIGFPEEGHARADTIMETLPDESLVQEQSASAQLPDESRVQDPVEASDESTAQDPVEASEESIAQDPVEVASGESIAQDAQNPNESLEQDPEDAPLEKILEQDPELFPEQDPEEAAPEEAAQEEAAPEDPQEMPIA